MTKQNAEKLYEAKCKELVFEALAEIENNANKSYDFVITGFRNIDFEFNLHKSNIITIAGRPAMGKTSFLLSICTNQLKKDKKVLVYSFEYNHLDIMFSLFHILSGIYRGKFKNGCMLSIDWSALTKCAEDLLTKKIFINDKKSMNKKDIKKDIKKMNPDVVLIDGIEIFCNYRNDRIFEYVKELKRIAIENNKTILITCPLSRRVDYRQNKKPLLGDLKYEALEELSDSVLMIYRPEYYDRENLDLKGKFEVIIRKNNFGNIGNVYLMFDSRTLKIYDYSSLGED